MTIKRAGLGRIIVSLGLLTLVAMAFVPPIPQPQSYHNFADQNAYLGIPHFWNVLSNLPFLVVAVIGLRNIAGRDDQANRTCWVIFCVGVGLVAVGSSTYHWDPSNETLVWDRMPMTIGFVAALTAVAAELFGIGLTRWLWVFLAIGISSVCVWWAFDDLRFYGWVQFFPFLVFVIMLLNDDGAIRSKQHIVYAMLYYGGAKIFENWDAAVYSLSGELMSGHAIKHVLAALATWELVRRLRKLHD